MARKTEQITAIVVFVALITVLLYDLAMFIWWDHATVSAILKSYFNTEASPLMCGVFGAVIGMLLSHFLAWTPKPRRSEWEDGNPTA